MSRFEWVWLKINIKTNKVAWERPIKRNRVVGCFSGVLHTVWGEHEEVFLQSSACVELTTYKKVKEGFVLVVTGGCHTLGNWDLQKAVTANGMKQPILRALPDKGTEHAGLVRLHTDDTFVVEDEP
ncbi:hypothetical protein PoB_004465800 [Plakobranchus ocellatus]|uniref:CBM20 domain-containing protein n=1 Tax=Plakobranchus ocellatus TaxID=259542 RepID=A0AAV4BG77_9GAST|nr:hypothetical protein PoB_004465800 [Plakobranchus ocellatus]